MDVFDVKILSSSKEECIVQYSLLIRPGVVRRSKAVYRNGVLSRDGNNNELLNLIKEKISVSTNRASL